MQRNGNSIAPVAAIVVTVLLLWAELPVAVLNGQQAQPGAGGGGRGGFGGMRASQVLFEQQCSGCHGGADGSTGRAPNLFDRKWLNTVSDDQIQKKVRTGIANTEMSGFSVSQLNDQQLFELIAFLRTTSGNLAPKVDFVPDPDGKVIHSENQTFKIEVLARNIETPWGMAFLPDGRLLLTERGGHIRIYSKGHLSEPVSGTPTAHVQQDGGFLDITVQPQYARNGWVYLAYTEVLPGFTPPAAAPASTPGPTIAGAGGGRGRGPQIPSNTVIVRGKINAKNEWNSEQVVFRSPARLYATTGVHYGCRFLWDKEGHLFFTLGDRGTMQSAQELMDNPLGKIHRINDDGTPAKDNPFVKKEGADKTIWSYGHRNPEGLAWDPVSGKLWEAEHGPTGGDEINIIQPGHNYGWGVISMGIQPGITERVHEGMEQPVVYFTPGIAPAAISFYTGNRYAGWKNSSLFVGALKGQQLRRLEIRGSEVTHQEVVFAEFGRVRDIVQGPDGYFYIQLQNPTGVNGISLSASTPGMLIRLVPVV